MKKKANVVDFAAQVIRDDIKLRGAEDEMTVGNFTDELVFAWKQDKTWYMYKLTKKQCKKFFYNLFNKDEGETILDKLMRKAGVC